jgi:hypothetical protein
MMEHTKEPWECGHGLPGIFVPHQINEDGDVDFDVIAPKVSSEANARRIVAAVNACQGMETEWLEEFVEFAASGPPMVNLWNNTQLYNKLMGQHLRERDAALAMVRELVEWVENIRHDPKLVLRVQQVWKDDDLLTKAEALNG